MKKYTYPQMEIVFFNSEEVATTASAATMESLETWEENVSLNGLMTDKRMVDFEKTLKFTF